MDLARSRTKFFRVADDGSFEVSARGFDVLRSPEINKGTAFPEHEREALGLVGLLPPAILSIEQQAERAYEILEKLDDLGRYRFLTGVRDRNETLFFHIVAAHITEMLPVIYTPTVGLAIQQYSRQFRRPHGIFLSIDRQDDMEQARRRRDRRCETLAP